MKDCPRCHEGTMREVKSHNALSRRDNKTYICSQCGTEEAFIDAGLHEMLEGSIADIFTKENAFRKSLGIKEMV